VAEDEALSRADRYGSSWPVEPSGVDVARL